MSGLLILFLAAAAPILLVAGLSAVVRSVPFRWANVFKLYLTLLFGFFGLYAHVLHPKAVVELIPPWFPFRTLSSYASGVLELAFAVLIWTGWARITAWVIIVYLVLVLPFNIYGWTIPANTPSYVNSPYYLWLRVPMQVLFIAFAWFGTRGETPAERRPD
jgi:uncharacterized membrane protein